MTSPEKSAANRQNAKKSTGPKTTGGKARSARNALTHGLTAKPGAENQADGPGDPTEEYRANLAEWIGDLKSKGIAERTLAERACRAAWSLKRCDRYEDATAARRNRDAADLHDLAEEAKAEALGRRLLEERWREPSSENGKRPAFQDADPRDWPVSQPVVETDKRFLPPFLDEDPAMLVAALKATAAGVSWLLARWAGLGRALNESGGWDAGRQYAAMRLLGLRPDAARDHQVGMTIYAPPHELGSAMPIATWLGEPAMAGALDAAIAAHERGLGDVPTLFMGCCAAIAAKDQGDGRSGPGTAKLRAMVRCERAKLLRLKTREMNARAAEDRAGAADRALFDDARSLSLCLRYATAASRDLHRSIADLAKLRKAAGDEGHDNAPDPPAPPRPVGGDGLPQPVEPGPEPGASPPSRDATDLRNKANLAPGVALDTGESPNVSGWPGSALRPRKSPDSATRSGPGAVVPTPATQNAQSDLWNRGPRASSRGAANLRNEANFAPREPVRAGCTPRISTPIAGRPPSHRPLPLTTSPDCG